MGAVLVEPATPVHLTRSTIQGSGTGSFPEADDSFLVGDTCR